MSFNSHKPQVCKKNISLRKHTQKNYQTQIINTFLEIDEKINHFKKFHFNLREKMQKTIWKFDDSFDCASDIYISKKICALQESLAGVIKSSPDLS